MPPLFLVLGFFLVAVLYAAVGFGGGSTYNALLVLAQTDYRAVPLIALTCNIIVVSGGIYHFSRAGHFSWAALMPFAAASIPMAWLGGRIDVSETVFVGLLGITLLLTASHLFFRQVREPEARTGYRANRWLVGLPIGASIGFISGMVGVGGGIFLAPLLYLFRLEPPRRIAAMASGFILINSAAGLAGQLMKQGDNASSATWLSAWPLYLAVLVGGQLGSRWGALGLPEARVRQLTGILLLYVAIRLLLRWAELSFA
jgi:uncharacterized membrane protein YfcA